VLGFLAVLVTSLVLLIYGFSTYSTLSSSLQMISYGSCNISTYTAQPYQSSNKKTYYLALIEVNITDHNGNMYIDKTAIPYQFYNDPVPNYQSKDDVEEAVDPFFNRGPSPCVYPTNIDTFPNYTNVAYLNSGSDQITEAQASMSTSLILAIVFTSIFVVVVVVFVILEFTVLGILHKIKTKPVG